MDMLKTLSFTVVLLLIGAVFFVLGITGGFSVGSYTIALSNVALRFLICGTGLALVAVAVVSEVRPRLLRRDDRGQAEDMELRKAEAPTAQDFFYKLDDAPSKAFPNMVESALLVSILGRTAVNLLGQYQKVFEDLGNRECEIRILFVNPLSAACGFLYGSNTDVYKSNAATAVSHVNRMAQTAKRHLQIRVMDGAPTVSLVIVDKKDVKSSFLQVQLYFLHGAIGRDRPIFRVKRDDGWYSVFRDEFESLWTNGEERDSAKYLEHVQSQG